MNDLSILESLKGDDEVIATYATTDGYRPLHCIIRKDSDDIASALEDTLHRLIENGNDPYVIMGAFRPSLTEWEELKEYNEYIYVDLDYVISGLIDYFSLEE